MEVAAPSKEILLMEPCSSQGRGNRHSSVPLLHPWNSTLCPNREVFEAASAEDGALFLIFIIISHFVQSPAQTMNKGASPWAAGFLQPANGICKRITISMAEEDICAIQVESGQHSKDIPRSVASILQFRARVLHARSTCLLFKPHSRPSRNRQHNHL
jgi:hypothetical protein